jgi:hypothetical protein
VDLLAAMRGKLPHTETLYGMPTMPQSRHRQFRAVASRGTGFDPVGVDPIAIAYPAVGFKSVVLDPDTWLRDALTQYARNRESTLDPHHLHITALRPLRSLVKPSQRARSGHKRHKPLQPQGFL